MMHSCRFQIVQYLSLILPRKRFHCFEFYQYGIIDNYIRKIITYNGTIFVMNDNRKLLLNI